MNKPACLGLSNPKKTGGSILLPCVFFKKMYLLKREGETLVFCDF